MQSNSLPRLFLHLAAFLHTRKPRNKQVCRKDNWFENTGSTARIIYLNRKADAPVAGPAKVIPMYS